MTWFEVIFRFFLIVVFSGTAAEFYVKSLRSDLTETKREWYLTVVGIAISLLALNLVVIARELGT